MKNLGALLALGGVGYIFWESVTPEMWWEVGKWVGTGLLTLIVLLILIRSIRNRAEERDMERQMEKVQRMRPKHPSASSGYTTMHPQIMYIPQPSPYPQQAPQQPAGLIDLPLDKYEWEI